MCYFSALLLAGNASASISGDFGAACVDELSWVGLWGRLPSQVREVALKEHADFVEDYYRQTDHLMSAKYLAGADFDFAHPLFYTTHGTSHVADISSQVLDVLHQLNDLRFFGTHYSGEKLRSLEELCVALTFQHDMGVGQDGMSMEARSDHPEFATREAMGAVDGAKPTDRFDKVLEAYLKKNGALVQWIQSLHLAHPTAVTLREVLSMSNAHNEISVPTEMLADVGDHRQNFRELMLQSAGYSRGRNLQRESKLKAFWERRAHTRRAGEPDEVFHAKNFRVGAGFDLAPGYEERGLYSDYEREAFSWINPQGGEKNAETREFLQMICDAILVVRSADALRPRGLSLRASGEQWIGFNSASGNLIYSLQLGGKRYLVESPKSYNLGEANMASSAIDGQGNLRVSFVTETFPDPGIQSRMAESMAERIDDLKRDLLDSFPNRRQLIVLEYDPANPKFAHDVQDRLLSFEDLAGLVTLTPRAQSAKAHDETESEKARYESAPQVVRAENLVWLKKLLSQFQDAGRKFGDGGDPASEAAQAFHGARLIQLNPGQELFAAGTPGHFAYLVLGDGLRGRPADRQLEFTVPQNVLVGEISALRNSPRFASLINESKKPVRVIAIPRETYLKSWTQFPSLEEFKRLLKGGL